MGELSVGESSGHDLTRLPGCYWEQLMPSTFILANYIAIIYNYIYSIINNDTDPIKTSNYNNQT